MGLKQKIKSFWYNIHDQYKQYLKDKKARKQFKINIKEVSEDRESLFNQYGLKAIDDFTKIFYIIDIPEEYQLRGQPWQIMDKLNESTYFLSKYLRENVNIGENLTMPSYYHIEDPSSNTPLSCRYLATWEFEDLLKSKKVPYIINSLIGIFSVGILSTATFFILKICMVI